MQQEHLKTEHLSKNYAKSSLNYRCFSFIKVVAILDKIRDNLSKSFFKSLKESPSF